MGDRLSPRPAADSWTGTGAARVGISTHMGRWGCRLRINLLCHPTSPSHSFLFKDISVPHLNEGEREERVKEDRTGEGERGEERIRTFHLLLRFTPQMATAAKARSGQEQGLHSGLPKSLSHHCFPPGIPMSRKLDWVPSWN